MEEKNRKSLTFKKLETEVTVTFLFVMIHLKLYSYFHRLYVHSFDSLPGKAGDCVTFTLSCNTLNNVRPETPPLTRTFSNSFSLAAARRDIKSLRRALSLAKGLCSIERNKKTLRHKDISPSFALPSPLIRQPTDADQNKP